MERERLEKQKVQNEEILHSVLNSTENRNQFFD